MGDDKEGKEFDVDKIKHGEFMDAKDRQYFEKYGSAMGAQAEIIKENMDDYIKYANEVYDDVMKRLAGNMNQYLVQGACLKCSKQLKTESVQNLFYGDSEIKSKADDVETNSALQILAARTENANGLPFANVTDTRGGLSGELLKGGAKEGEEEENQLNIVSFGNCGFLEEEKITDVEKMAERVLQILHSHSDLGDRCRHNGITKDRIKKGILEGIQSGKGTCYGCMVLNTEWENLPEEYDYAENTFDAMPGAVGIEGFLEGKQYFQFGGKEAINMMSMLFCRFGGGIINAKDSGQINNITETQAHIKAVLETLGWPVELEELRHIDSILSEFGITDLNSITCFLLICVSESGAIGLYADKVDRNGEKYVDRYGRGVTEYYPIDKKAYSFEERGVAYMQVTGKKNQLECLQYLKEKGYYDGDIDEDAAGYVSELRELPWETSAWRWAVCKQTEDGYPLNDYVMARLHDNDDQLIMGIFLTAECFNNGIVDSEKYIYVNDLLHDIARGEGDWTYNIDEGKIQVGAKSFPAPVNWDQFEAKYELLKGAGLVCNKE